VYNDGDWFNGLLSQWRSACEETKCKGGMVCWLDPTCIAIAWRDRLWLGLAA